MDLLFLAHRAPWPPDRGDRIRSYNVLRYLAKRARVHLVAFGDDPTPPADIRLASCTIVPRAKRQVCAAIEAIATRRPISLTAFADPCLRAAVASVRADRAYAFSGQMAQYLPAGVPAVMDFVDVDSAKFAALADGSRFPMDRVYAREATLLARYERHVAAGADATLFVSDAEAALFRVGGGHGNIATVENGIDTTVFDPAASFARVEGQGLIVFTGQMDYRPNIDAAVWFAEQVLPAIHRQFPAMRFAIVGRAPTPRVRALASDAVIVTGEVADVRGWLAAAAVCVAPLQLARGIQNKVLEAMAMARPVIASACAAEGIDHCGTIRVASDAAAFADHVTALFENPQAAETLGAAARARVLERYDWDAQLKPLDALLGLAA